MNEYRLRQFLESKGMRDEIELTDALSHARELSKQTQGGRLLPKHVDAYLRSQESVLAPADLAALQKLGQWFLAFDAQQNAPAQMPRDSAPAPAPRESSGRWRGVISIVVVAALLIGGALNFNKIRRFLINRTAGSSFAAQRAALPNIAQATVPEDNEKARECLAGLMIGKVAYSDARVECYGDGEARKVQERGDKMTQAQFESYLREQSKLRSGASNQAIEQVEVEAGPPAPREGDPASTVVLYVKAFAAGHQAVRALGTLEYKLSANGRDTIQKTVQIGSDTYTGGAEPALRIIVDVPGAKRNETSVDVDVSFANRNARSIRYSF